MSGHPRTSSATRDDDMESRALLPTRNSDSWEYVTNPGNHVGAYASSRSGDEFLQGERDVWRHFESYKRSATFHVEEYLQYNAQLRAETRSSVNYDTLEREARDGGQVAKTFWDLKVARDNLLNELEILQSLLEQMAETSKKWLAKFYALIAFFSAAAATLSASGDSKLSKVLWGSSVAIVSGLSVYTGYRISRRSTIRLCSEAVKSLLDRLGQNSLDEHDRDVLKSRRFQVLWWVYYFTAKETEAC